MRITILCALCVLAEMWLRAMILFCVMGLTQMSGDVINCAAILFCMRSVIASGCALIALIVHLEPRVVCGTLATPLLIPPQTTARAPERALVQVPAQALLRIVILAPTLPATQTRAHLLVPQTLTQTLGKLDFPLYGNGQPWWGAIAQACVPPTSQTYQAVCRHVPIAPKAEQGAYPVCVCLPHRPQTLLPPFPPLLSQPYATPPSNSPGGSPYPGLATNKAHDPRALPICMYARLGRGKIAPRGGGAFEPLPPTPGRGGGGSWVEWPN